MNQCFYVPPLRGLDRPEYALSDNVRLALSTADNAQLVSNIAYSDRAVEDSVSEWSKIVTGSELSFRAVPGGLVTARSYVAPGGIPIIGDGSGTNQLVHLLTMLAMTPSKSVLAIDEPEIHLHPKAQDKLCQILLDVAQKNNKQLVITTHSVHVLFFFVNATRKGELSADELAIWDFETKNAPPKRIVQDEGGDIYDWGREFGFP